MDVFDTCHQIRQDWAEQRLDAGKGKKCPGGYSIPSNKKCGGGKGKKAAALAAGLAVGAAGAGAYLSSRGGGKKAPPQEEAPAPQESLIRGPIGETKGKAEHLGNRARAEATGMVRKARSYASRSSAAMTEAAQARKEQAISAGREVKSRAAQFKESQSRRASRAVAAASERAGRIARRRQSSEQE